MTTLRNYSSRQERGVSPAVEAAIVIPGFVVLVGLLIVVARTVIAHQEVEAATSAAARAASVQRQVADGDKAAREVLSASLNEGHLKCIPLDISTNMGGLSSPLGTPSAVTVTVRCTVNLSDVAMPGFPGSHTIEVTRSSPVDTYRQR